MGTRAGHGQEELSQEHELCGPNTLHPREIGDILSSILSIKQGAGGLKRSEC